MAGMVENPWHLHPLVFLDAIKPQVKTLEGKLTYNAEGNDISSSIYYSRVIPWPGNNLSGVTLGRGYDMGDRSESDVYNDMAASGIPNVQAVKISKCAGLKGIAARDYVSTHKKDIGEITLQQQETLFLLFILNMLRGLLLIIKNGLMVFPVRNSGKAWMQLSKKCWSTSFTKGLPKDLSLCLQVQMIVHKS